MYFVRVLRHLLFFDTSVCTRSTVAPRAFKSISTLARLWSLMPPEQPSCLRRHSALQRQANAACGAGRGSDTILQLIHRFYPSIIWSTLGMFLHRQQFLRGTYFTARKKRTPPPNRNPSLRRKKYCGFISSGPTLTTLVNPNSFTSRSSSTGSKNEIHGSP